MAIMTPLALTSADHFNRVQQATARKLIDTAVARTGTSAADWVVRPFCPDGGTGPTATGVGTLGTPDLSLTDAFDVEATQLGWAMDASAVTEPSVAWATLNVDTTVPDMTFYGFFGWWEAHHGGGTMTNSGSAGTGASNVYPPSVQAWNFTSGAQTLDIMFTESQHFSTYANGGITNAPIIFTQNSNIQLKYWLADSSRVASFLMDDHATGLWGLTCERAGETLAAPGIHTMMPLGLAGSGAYLAAQQSAAANNLIAMAAKETNSTPSDWIVREFNLDDAGVGPLTKMDLSSDVTIMGALGSGWQVTASAVTPTAWTSVLVDTTIPDNTFMAIIGGFEAPHGAYFDADQTVAGPIGAGWAISKGASTVGFYPTECVGSWESNWGFVADNPLYFKQNETINIRHISTEGNHNIMDTTMGLNILVCERVGENISSAKISN